MNISPVTRRWSEVNTGACADVESIIKTNGVAHKPVNIGLIYSGPPPRPDEVAVPGIGCAGICSNDDIGSSMRCVHFCGQHVSIRPIRTNYLTDRTGSCRSTKAAP